MHQEAPSFVDAQVRNPTAPSRTYEGQFVHGHHQGPQGVNPRTWRPELALRDGAVGHLRGDKTVPGQVGPKDPSEGECGPSETT